MDNTTPPRRKTTEPQRLVLATVCIWLTVMTGVFLYTLQTGVACR